ncbi:hypothetical protein EMIT0357P_10779 [Pseudomonas marginalis]
MSIPPVIFLLTSYKNNWLTFLFRFFYDLLPNNQITISFANITKHSGTFVFIYVFEPWRNSVGVSFLPFAYNTSKFIFRITRTNFTFKHFSKGCFHIVSI